MQTKVLRKVAVPHVGSNGAVPDPFFEPYRNVAHAIATDIVSINHLPFTVAGMFFQMSGDGGLTGTKEAHVVVVL